MMSSLSCLSEDFSSLETTMLNEILVRCTVYDGDEKILLTSSRVMQEKPRRSKLTLKNQQKYTKYQSLET